MTRPAAPPPPDLMERPRAVWRPDGGMIVIRLSPRPDLDGELEEFEVPVWVAQHIYSMGERELVSDARREAFAAAYNKRGMDAVALLTAMVSVMEAEWKEGIVDNDRRRTGFALIEKARSLLSDTVASR